MRARYSITGEVFHAVISRAYTTEDARELRDAFSAAVKQHGVRRAVFDLRTAEPTSSTTDVYRLNSTLEELIPKDARFAFVYAPETIPTEMAKFAENVLVNRGYEARFFTETDAALRWVNAES